MFATIIFSLIVFPICIAIIAAQKGFFTPGWYMYGLVLWPIALAHVLSASPTPTAIEHGKLKEGRTKCQLCSEWIMKEAKICPFCRTNFVKINR